jgi:hypothetical protein
MANENRRSFTSMPREPAIALATLLKRRFRLNQKRQF